MTIATAATKSTVAALICVLSTDVTACGVHHSNPPGPTSGCGPGTFPVPYARIDSCSAPAVLLAAANAVFSARPSEQSPRDAVQSAAALVAPGYLRALEDAAAILWPVTGATWAQWATADVRVRGRARISADDHPADTASSISRVLVIAEDLSTGAGPAPFPVHMQAARTGPGGSWLVDMVEVPA
ncbi:hypothetical protein [Nocardia sp. alder85J]|uniref:hypothetical protein n=1 Tax=Nocardia sp. alder85J TaxID=2862949 RepID=UPI001CD20D32|nr:hypothetical protein [Nocardia sp. alder85J]MCX4098428.1 hypothetical protein [Nocardia sp. alder85J]